LLAHMKSTTMRAHENTRHIPYQPPQATASEAFAP
jgi:hypothetical protein